MADYHFHGKAISRGNGRSAIAAAAYRAGDRLESEYDGKTHDYTKKGGVIHSEIMLCENAPIEYQNREKLWNAVEKAASANGRLARDFDVALPIELNKEEQIQLVRDFVKDNFVNNGMCADFAIHDKSDGNPHAHIMLTLRPIDKDGDWEYVSQKAYICKDHDGNVAELTADELKKENADGKTFEKQLPYFKNGKGRAVYLTKHEAENDPKYKEYVRIKGKKDPLKTKEDRKNPKIEKWDSVETFNKWREEWANYQNRELEKKNLPQRVDHRSYKARGISKIPTTHKGVSSVSMEQRGIETDRGNINRQNEKATADISKLSKESRILAGEIMAIRQDISLNKVHEQMQMIDKTVDKIIASKDSVKNEPVLRNIMEKVEQLKLVVMAGKPAGDNQHKTIESTTGQVPYIDYHRNKFISDYSYIEGKAKSYFAELERQLQEQSRPTAAPSMAAKERAVGGDPPRTTETPPTAPTAFDVSGAARQLAAHRAEYVNATIQAAQRTSYQENPIYRQQALQIGDCAKVIKEHTASIDKLKAERGNLGLLQGKQKKAIESKITEFERSRRAQYEKLKELGVSKPENAEKAIKEKLALAGQERAKAKAAQESAGAGDRADSAKAAYISLARSIPESQKQAVLAETEKHKPEGGKTNGMAYYKAEAAARDQLDRILKPEQSRTHDRDRGRDRER